MKTTFIIIAIISGLTLGGIAIKVIFFPVNTANKLIQTAYDAQDKTLKADNAIYNYEWFKQQNEDIIALGNKITNASIALDTFKKDAGDRTKWTFEDKTESSRLESLKLGLQNQLEQVIADYNARAKMANRNIFQNNIIPGFIDSMTFLKK